MTDRWVRPFRLPLRGVTGRGVVPAVVATLLTLFTVSSAFAQAGTVAGRVTDAGTGEPVAQAQVELVTGGGGVVRSTITNAAGEFLLTGIPAGGYSLVFRRLAYETRRLDGINVGAQPTAVGTVTLVSRALRVNPIIVTASRREEKALEAPASISIVDRREIEERPATTAIDHVRDVPGVDVVKTGVAQHNVVARGFNNVFSGALYVLTDNRWASIPSLRFNAYNLIPTTDEDIDRIEVVLGPGSALYGPNADKGVMHIVTRSPLQTQQTALSVVGGEREIFQASFRHAGIFSEKAGYKISGMYFRGRDWVFQDPVEVANRQAAIDAGADPATLLIGARDFDAERFTGEARLDFSLADETGLVLSGGLTQMVKSVEMTGIGSAQGKDWRYTYAQARLRHRNFFAQSYINLSDAGDTYLLRDGSLIQDNSFMYVGQIQNTTEVGERQRFIYGADLVQTVPRTDSTINGQNEEDDNITEIGGYVQSETQLSPKVDFVAAVRLDDHSRIDELVVSPRAAFVFKPAEGHNFRVTYNRAFSQPTANNLFLDITSSPSLGGLPFAVRASGVPESGFTFRRDCPGGLCMHSPFTPGALGGPATPLPLDATLFWDAAVLIFFQSTGIDLSALPAPDASTVSTAMRTLDATTLAFNTVSDVTDVAPLEPTITNTIELGYKGFIADRLLLGVDVYFTRVEDFVGPLLVETPSVFLERESLETYLSPFLGPAAGQIAAGMAGIDGDPAVTGIPLATVTPEQTLGQPADLMLTYRNFGEVELWGADLGATVVATDQLSFSGTYSFVNKNLFPNLDGIADIALNAPENKATLSGTYRNERLGLGVELRGRYVDAFAVQSGVFTGRVKSYRLLDANVTYTLPFARSTELALTGANILDHRHREMVGAPELGRMLLLRLRQTF